jgi:uncharacterized protein DUF6178
MPNKQVSREIRSLRTVLNNPALPALIQSLPARELAHLCGRIGISDAMDIMALAPAERLVQALEASVWKTPRPGVSEVLDTRELVEWIWAWLDIGEVFTAERLAVVPDEDLTLYLSQVATVTTAAMWGFERSTEIGDLERIYAPSHDEKGYGPYVVSAKRLEDWETLRGALDAMWSDAPERLLHLFAQLSGDESMLAPQRNRESSNDDVLSARENARECRGYVTAHGARAFLTLARRPLKDLAALSEYDLETRRHLAALAGDPRRDPDTGALGDADNTVAPAPDISPVTALQVALEEAGLLEPPPQRLLLTHEPTSKQLPLVKLLQSLAEKNAVEFDTRSRELAYLGSVLIAGIAIDGSTLKPTEARSAALATCNLGLETLSSHGEPVRIDREPGLVRLFLVGFSVLSTLPARVVESFVQSLQTLKNATSEPAHEWLVEQAEVSVADLSDAVRKGDFEAAREATMALCFVFEPRACRAVVPLLDEIPRLRTGNGAAATWIDSMAALASAAEQLRTLTPKRRRRRPPSNIILNPPLPCWPTNRLSRRLPRRRANRSSQPIREAQKAKKEQKQQRGPSRKPHGPISPPQVHKKHRDEPAFDHSDHEVDHRVAHTQMQVRAPRRQRQQHQQTEPHQHERSHPCRSTR